MKLRLCVSALLLSLGFLPVTAKAAAIQVNGTMCEVGTCASPDQLTFGQSVGPTAFSFLYADSSSGDQFTIAGSYAASYGVNGTAFSVDMSATYTGASPSAAADTFKVDVLQNVFDTACCTWAGTYSESALMRISDGVGADTSATVDYLWDGVGVGPLTASGPGIENLSLSSDLEGAEFTDALLTGDMQATFNFGAGTAQGSAIEILSPEPVETLPVAAFLLVAAWTLRKNSQRRCSR